MHRQSKKTTTCIGDRHKFQVHRDHNIRWRLQPRNYPQNSPNHCRTIKTPTYYRELKDQTYEILGYVDLFICLPIMDIDCWPRKNELKSWKWGAFKEYWTGPCYEWSSPKALAVCLGTVYWYSDTGQTTQTAMDWSCNPPFWPCPHYRARHSTGWMETRQTKEGIEG